MRCIHSHQKSRQFCRLLLYIYLYRILSRNFFTIGISIPPSTFWTSFFPFPAIKNTHKSKRFTPCLVIGKSYFSAYISMVFCQALNCLKSFTADSFAYLNYTSIFTVPYFIMPVRDTKRIIFSQYNLLLKTILNFSGKSKLTFDDTNLFPFINNISFFLPFRQFSSTQDN